MYKLTKRLLCVLAICLFTPIAQADDFTQATFIEGSDKYFSFYPSVELRMARTARVWVSYIIKKDGTVSEPMIEQINNDGFNKAIIKWTKHWRFEPATVNGEPVDSWARGRRAFNIGYDQRSGRVSTSLFNKLNKKFGDEIAKSQPNQEKLERLLKKLTKVKHGSSLAYEFIANRRHQFAKKFLDKDAQIYAIREILLSNDRGLVWGNGAIIDEELIDLLLEAGYQGEALDAYYSAQNKLKPIPRSRLWGKYRTRITKIIDNVDNDEVFARSISIGPNGYLFLPLLKKKFKLNSVQGTLNTIKLRCEKQFAEFKLTEDSEYQTHEKWGACQLQVLGSSGSTAQLIQF